MKKTHIKIITIAAIMLIMLVLTITLASCGNVAIGPGNYSFKKVHINTQENSCCVDIDKWYDSEATGIEVHSEEYGAMFLSEGSYILIEDKCPICDK